MKVTSNLEVCARWKPPATPNGVVTLYKLYAEIIGSSADITEAVDLPTGTAVKVCLHKYWVILHRRMFWSFLYGVMVDLCNTSTLFI